MLSINTNLGSLIVQSNLSKSTLGLQQAIERMTTGFKINHAKDNAAGYSIATNMTTKIGAYEVAESNALMGLDLVTTASESLDLISSHLQRLRDLAEQAANGTYGEESLEAIQAEADARISEINRIAANTEYNGINLRGAGDGGNLKEINPVTEQEAIDAGYIIIKTPDDLQAMKDNLSGKYILMNDIDLSGYEWEAVGSYTDGAFTGELNGNGYIIKNLTINNQENSQGFFGLVEGANLQNIALENVYIYSEQGMALGGLVGTCNGGSINNSYVTGKVAGYRAAGGLIGYVDSMSSDISVTNCYANIDINTSDVSAGGLVGHVNTNGTYNFTVSDSYSSGNISGTSQLGGLIGVGGYININNCYSTAAISGILVGGLIGGIWGTSSLSNCYARNQNLQGNFIGGLFGSSSNTSVTNCYFDTELAPNVTALGVPTATTNGTINGISTNEFQEMWQNGTLSDFSGQRGQIIQLQVGIDSSSNSCITLDTSFSINIGINLLSSQSAKASLASIDKNLKLINSKQTELGAAQNRLESALESISVSYENLVSSRSTIRDADVAEESSAYIRNQILQQAAATLLATANQTPSIALQLL